MNTVKNTVCLITRLHGFTAFLTEELTIKYRDVYKNTKNKVHLDEIQNLSFEVDFEEELLKNVSIDKLKTKIISKLTNDEYNLYELIYEKGTKYAEITDTI